MSCTLLRLKIRLCLSDIVFSKNFFLVNWDVEHQIWDRLFGASALNVNYAETRLVLTDPGENIPALKDSIAQMVFEDYGFQALFKTSGIVLYTGISFTK